MGNADLLSNKSRLSDSTRHSRWALWQEEREQLELQHHKTRVSFKYSSDFWKSIFAAFCSILCLFVSSFPTEGRTEFSQHKKILSDLLCGYCLNHRGWIFYFLSFYHLVCLFVQVCYYAHTYVSVLCPVSRDKPRKKHVFGRVHKPGSWIQPRTTTELLLSTAFLTCCLTPISLFPTIPCTVHLWIQPPLHRCISKLPVMKQKCGSYAFCNLLLNNWLAWEAVEGRPLLEVNITASQG